MRRSLSATSLGLLVGLSGVTCALAGDIFIPPTPGDLYPDWGNAGTGKSVVGFDLGTTNRDFAVDSVVMPDGGMILVGTVRKANGKNAIGVLRLDANGDPDLNFSGDGKNTSLLEDVTATSMAIGNNRIYVAGYTTNNAPDSNMVVCQFRLSNDIGNGAFTNFPAANNGGCISPNLVPGSQDQAHDILVQSDGKIVIAGTVAPANALTSKSAAFVRFNADGSPDSGNFGTSFGVSIIRDTVKFSSHDIRAITQASNGKLVAAGWTTLAGATDSAGLVMRLDTSGNLDEDSFGETFIGYDGSPTRDTRLRDLITVDDPDSDDDAIVLVGEVELTLNELSGLITKVTSDVSASELSFGTHPGRSVFTIAGENLEFHDVTVDENDAYIVSGALSYLDNGFATTDIEVRRIQPDGSLHTGFGDLGVTTVDFGTVGGINFPAGISVRGDAAYVGASAYHADDNADFAAAKIALPAPPNLEPQIFSDGFESP